MIAELSTLMYDVVEHPGPAFREALPIVLIATCVLIVVHLLLAMLGGKTPLQRARWNIWETLVYLATVVSVGVLGVTSFYSVIRFGVMGGWLLFAHMFGAGLFVFVLPLIAITWSEANRFGQRPAGDESQISPLAPRFIWLAKLMFWLLLASGLAVSATMLVSMLPLFGTDGLLRLLDIHRYSGLVAVVAATLHFYCVVLQRVRLR